MKMRIA